MHPESAAIPNPDLPPMDAEPKPPRPYLLIAARVLVWLMALGFTFLTMWVWNHIASRTYYDPDEEQGDEFMLFVRVAASVTHLLCAIALSWRSGYAYGVVIGVHLMTAAVAAVFAPEPRFMVILAVSLAIVVSVIAHAIQEQRWLGRLG